MLPLALAFGALVVTVFLVRRGFGLLARSTDQPHYRVYQIGPTPDANGRLAALNARPLHSSPHSVWLINGFGTALSWFRDYDKNTRTYSATYSWVVLFAPIFPMKRYVVRNVPPGRDRFNRYEFLGELDLTLGQKVIRMLTLLGLFVAVGIGIAVSL